MAVAPCRIQSCESAAAAKDGDSQEYADRERMALLEFIRDRKLQTAVQVLLELYRPLVGLGDALIIFSQPFIRMFSLQQGVLDILRSRANVDWLIAELDRKEEIMSALKVNSGK